MNLLVDDIDQFKRKCSGCGETFKSQFIDEFDFKEDYAICYQCSDNPINKKLHKQVIEEGIELTCDSCGDSSENFQFPQYQFTDSGFECIECFDVEQLNMREAFKYGDILERWLWSRHSEVEEYLDQYVSDLFEVFIDGDVHAGIPHWLEIPFKPDPAEIDAIDSEEDIELYHMARSAGGYYSTVPDHIAPTSEDDNEYVRIDQKRIGKELEMQTDDGELVYTSNEYDVGAYVAVPDSIKGKEDAVNTFREQAQDTMTIH